LPSSPVGVGHGWREAMHPTVDTGGALRRGVTACRCAGATSARRRAAVSLGRNRRELRLHSRPNPPIAECDGDGEGRAATALTYAMSRPRARTYRGRANSGGRRRRRRRPTRAWMHPARTIPQGCAQSSATAILAAAILRYVPNQVRSVRRHMSSAARHPRASMPLVARPRERTLHRTPQSDEASAVRDRAPRSHASRSVARPPTAASPRALGSARRSRPAARRKSSHSLSSRRSG